MASAAPILGQMLVGQMISKIGRDQGWNPMVTAGLGMLAGSGAGSAITGAQAANAAAGSFAGSTAMSVNPHAGFGIADIAPTRLPFGMSATPHMGMGVLNRPSGILPTPTGGPNSLSYDGPAAMDLDVMPNGRIGRTDNYFFPQGSDAPTYMEGGRPKWGELAAASTKDTFKNMWNDKEFATAMGGQFIDAAFAEEPPVQHQATGGGGGGSSPLGSPYQGGNGVSGQYKLTSGMPGRAQGIQWKGI